jgi:hypothetical protein
MAPGAPERGAGYRLATVAAMLTLLAGTGIGALLLFRSHAPMSDNVARSGPPLTPPPATVAATQTPTYRALVIGINRYAPANGTGWQELQCARPDAEAIGRVLKNEYGFEVRTLLDEQATRSAMVSTLDELATGCGEQDALLIYFAGHGIYDEKLKEGYWIPADARRSAQGRDAKEDWIWNSMLTRLFAAANARHVLVLADSCYSGALFRGDEPLAAHGGGRNWYAHAFGARSRYLITSGGLEPVLDSSSGHSVFAQQVLTFLSSGTREIFSANDLGLHLREKVARMTGQMVQMGPIPIGEHMGGEFVFLRKSAGTPAALLAAQGNDHAGSGAARAPEETGGTAAARQEALRNAASLSQAGATRAAGKVMAAMQQQNPQDPAVQTMAAYLDRIHRQEGRSGLQTLLAQLETQARNRQNGTTPLIRPRVLACLGPLPTAGSAASEGTAALYRILLSAELANRGVARIVERESLASLLQEQQLSLSDLADPRARTTIGKLLPAGLLLLGDLLPTRSGERLALRLVDTETTDVLASFQQDVPADGDLTAICAEMARRMAERLALLRPRQAPVIRVEGTHLRTEFGAFHGGRTNLVYTLMARTPREPAGEYTEQPVGSAVLRTLGEQSSELDATWTAGSAPTRTDNLWIRESP